jgi:hypothetical protein
MFVFILLLELKSRVEHLAVPQPVSRSVVVGVGLPVACLSAFSIATIKDLPSMK